MILAGTRPPWYVAPPPANAASADADENEAGDDDQSVRSAVDIGPRRPAD